MLCPAKEVAENKKATLNFVIQSLIDTKDKMVSGIAKLIVKLLDESNDFDKIMSDVDAVMAIADDAKVRHLPMLMLNIRKLPPSL